MKNKKWIGIIVAIVCIVLIIVGIMAVKSSRKSETERKSAVDDSTENSDGAIEGEEIPFEVTEETAGKDLDEFLTQMKDADLLEM